MSATKYFQNDQNEVFLRSLYNLENPFSLQYYGNMMIFSD